MLDTVREVVNDHCTMNGRGRVHTPENAFWVWTGTQTWVQLHWKGPSASLAFYPVTEVTWAAVAP